MEQLLFFSLGVVTVIAMALIVGTVRLQKQVVNLQHEIQNLQKQSENQERYFENRFRILEEVSNTVDTRIDAETRELYSTIDSRFDKLDNRLGRDLADINRESQAMYSAIERRIDETLLSVDVAELKSKNKSITKN